jgi:hypothetical protein
MRLSVGGQAVSIGGVNVSMPMPRITVSGKNFYRNGEIFKGFGMIPSAAEWYDNFFQTGGTVEDRKIMRQFMHGYRRCGANFIRFSTQMWDLIQGPDKDNLSIKPLAFDALIDFLNAARECDLYLVYSPNCNFLPQNGPAWYDALTNYNDRWDVQEFLLLEVAKTVVASGHQTTMWGYEVANESLINSNPVSPWYGGEFGEYLFVQYVALGIPEIDQPAVAQAYLTKLSSAVKSIDPSALCCLGGLMNGGGFAVQHIKNVVDFFQPHIYPPRDGTGDVTGALTALSGWTTGPHAILPCMIGETAAWSFSPMDAQLFDAMYPVVEAFATFSFGYPPSRYTFDADGNAAFPAPPWDGVEDGWTYILRFAINGLILQTGIDYRERFLTVWPENDL